MNAGAYGEEWAIAEARAADLTLFLGTPPLLVVYPEWQPLGEAVSRVVLHTACLYDGAAFDM